MLKITYSDSGILLEHLPGTVEALIAQRSVLCARLGQCLTIQPTYAALPLPRSLPQLPTVLQQLQGVAVEVAICDRTFLEITLAGTWLGEGGDSGIFLTSLDPAAEYQLWQLWQQSQRWEAAAAYGYN